MTTPAPSGSLVAHRSLVRVSGFTAREELAQLSEKNNEPAPDDNETDGDSDDETEDYVDWRSLHNPGVAALSKISLAFLRLQCKCRGG